MYKKVKHALPSFRSLHGLVAASLPRHRHEDQSHRATTRGEVMQDVVRCSQPLLHQRRWPRRRVLLSSAIGVSLFINHRLASAWWIDALSHPGGDPEEHATGAERSRMIKVMRLPVPFTNSLGWAALRRRFGGLLVPVQATSQTRDDVTIAEDTTYLDRFIDAVTARQELPFSYVKLLDDDPTMARMDGIGSVVTAELTAALSRERVPYTPPLHWSLWMGANSSTTSMHWDYQAFSLIHVVEGLKRFVLIDPAFKFACTEQPAVEPHSCWTHLNILSQPPPYAHELLLGPGETLIIPYGQWHAVENVGPTVAFGLNTWIPD